jgi:hypothetical protein
VTRDEAAAVARRDWDKLPHELKVSIEPADLQRALDAAEVPFSSGKRREVWLFDTPQRALGKCGLTLRLRHKKKDADFTVKVRPVLLNRLEGRWLKSRRLELEADVVGGRRLLSAAVERAVPKAAPRVELSPLQRALLREVARVDLPAGLRPTLSADVTVWKLPGLSLERWDLPRGSAVLEVSTTVAGDLFQAQALWLDLFLERAGVRKAKAQRTKTEALLRTL